MLWLAGGTRSPRSVETVSRRDLRRAVPPADVPGAERLFVRPTALGRDPDFRGPPETMPPQPLPSVLWKVGIDDMAAQSFGESACSPSRRNRIVTTPTRRLAKVRAALVDFLDPPLRPVLDSLDGNDVARGGVVAGRCTDCGCTDDAACDGGCWWADAERTRCSACGPSPAGG